MLIDHSIIARRKKIVENIAHNTRQSVVTRDNGDFVRLPRKLAPNMHDIIHLLVDFRLRIPTIPMCGWSL